MKLTFGRHTVETSNDDKLLFPKSGISKADVVEYYRSIADCMLPHLRDRCLTLQRFPDGIGAGGFYQQNRSDYFPDFVGTRTLPKSGGGEMAHIVADNAAALVYLADQAAITLHGWLSRAATPNRPDRLVFDLDPADGDFSRVIDCARLLRSALEACNLMPHVMTTGSRGLHVVAPIAGRLGFDAVREFAGRVAAAVAARKPECFSTAQRRKVRRGRLYIDTGRNAYGQTAVLPYSLRAIEGAPIATPLDWSELARRDLTPQKYTIRNLGRRSARKADPFADFYRRKRAPNISHDALARWAESG